MISERSCADCRFWRHEDHPSRATDDGECHRHAPTPTNQALIFAGEAIIAIADILSRHHGIEWPKGIEAEPTETTAAAMFPRVYGYDWCGEFQPKDTHW
jgi:hypothetical protein